MRKWWMGGLAAAMIALMIPSLAAASVARLAGLNVAGDYVKGEDTGMFTYLSQVNATGNLVWVEAGSAERRFYDHGVGAVIPGLFGQRYGVWSFNLRQQHPALGQGGSEDPVNLDAWDPDGGATGEAFDILWGHRLGVGNLGLRVHRSFQSTDDGTNTTEGGGSGERNILGFGVGYDFDLAENMPIQTVVQYQKRNYENSPTDKTDGGAAFLVAARVMHQCAGNVTVIPMAKYYSIDQSYVSGTTTNDMKLSGWQVGTAGNWILGSGDLFVFGAQVAGNKFDRPGVEESNYLFSPNVFVALETHLNPWLTFRAGANEAMFYSQEDKYTGSTQKYKNNQFSFNFGTSVKLGSLMLDATLDAAFLQNPFAQMMGGSSAFYYAYWSDRTSAPGGNPGTIAFPQVSATYTW